MALSFYKSDLRYLKRSYAFLAINNLVGVMDLIQDREDPKIEDTNGLRTIYNVFVFLFINLYCINIKPYKYKN